MLLRAVRAGLSVRSELRVEGVASRAQLEAAIAGSGLDLWYDLPFAGRIQGAYADGVVGVRKGLFPGTVLVVLAHELGHALLGDGEGLLVHETGGVRPRTVPECRAQLFAYSLLVGRPARTLDDLTLQMHRAVDGGLPWPFVCTAASILAARFEGVLGCPLLALV